MGTRSSLAGGKAAECETDHSPPSSAEVKNASSCTSTPPIPFTAWCSVKARVRIYLLHFSEQKQNRYLWIIGWRHNDITCFPSLNRILPSGEGKQRKRPHVYLRCIPTPPGGNVKESRAGSWRRTDRVISQFLKRFLHFSCYNSVVWTFFFVSCLKQTVSVGTTALRKSHALLCTERLEWIPVYMTTAYFPWE